MGELVLFCGVAVGLFVVFAVAEVVQTFFKRGDDGKTD